MSGASRQNANRSASFDEAVLEDPRWEALASGEATPEEIEDLRAWAERSEAAKAAWNAFQPATDEHLERFTDGVLRDLEARKVTGVFNATREGMIVGDKYRFRRVIAQGVLNSIWEGEDIVSGRIVAIKSPANVHQQELQPEIDKSLRREIHLLRRLSHPNIVEFLDAGETAGGEPFMVMQHLHGQDLRHLLKEKERIEPVLAVRIAREIASALVALHAARIMHCRIQPSNIFLHQSGRGDFKVKVIGFKTCIELVSFAHEEISSSSVSSSGIRYMSPESLLERKNVGERTDIWSLGVVLYEMLTGQPVFPGNSAEVINQILTTQVPPPSSIYGGVPPVLDDLIRRCTAAKREDRIKSAADVEEMLASIESKLVAANALSTSIGRRLKPAGGFMGATLPRIGSAENANGPMHYAFAERRPLPMMGVPPPSDSYSKEVLKDRPKIERKTYGILTLGIKATGKSLLVSTWADPAEATIDAETSGARYERIVRRMRERDGLVEHVFVAHEWADDCVPGAQQESIPEEMSGVILVVDLGGQGAREVDRNRIEQQRNEFSRQALRFLLNRKTLVTCKTFVLFINKGDLIPGSPHEVEEQAKRLYAPLIDRVMEYASIIDVKVLVGSVTYGHSTHHLYRQLVERILPASDNHPVVVPQMKAPESGTDLDEGASEPVDANNRSTDRTSMTLMSSSPGSRDSRKKSS